MKKLALLSSLAGLLIFGSLLHVTPTEASAVQSSQAIKNEVVFPTTNHSLFTQSDVNYTRVVKENSGSLFILASVSKLDPKYDLKIAEVDHKGTGVYNVKNVELEKIGGIDNMYFVKAEKVLKSSSLILFFADKNNPNIAVDYFFIN